MNEKELREIKRRFRPDKSNIPNIVGCFVNANGEIISRFSQSILLSENDESEALLKVMKKTLSGSLGTNLIDIEFSTNDVLESDTHKLLISLRDTSLKDNSVLERFYDKVRESVHFDGNYVILLANDIYDVFTKENDEESGSSTTFSYVICSVCPLKDTDAGLFFRESDRLFHSVASNAVLTSPVLGFMFPTFEDRMSNIYHSLFYTKDLAATHTEFMQNVFGKNPPMPAKIQKSTFDYCLKTALGEDCSLDTIKSVNRQIAEMLEEHKELKIPEPLTLTKATVKTILENCGADEAVIERLEKEIDEGFGKNAELRPKNIVKSGAMEIKLPDIVLKVKPEAQSLVSTQVIGGKKYILIEATDAVEVNGIDIKISE